MKYSRIIEAESGRHYRYDYTNKMLQWVYREVGSAQWLLVTQQGLQEENFTRNPEYWAGVFDREIEEELSCL